MEPKSIGTRSICQSVNEQLSGRVFLKNIYMYDTPTFYVLITKIEERYLLITGNFQGETLLYSQRKATIR